MPRTAEDYQKGYLVLRAYHGEGDAQPSIQEACNARRQLDEMFYALPYDGSA